MKSLLPIIIIVCLGWNLRAQTADQDVSAGLTSLAGQDLVHANQDFTNALALSPTNEAANALVAATRLLLLPSQPAGSNFLNSLGFSSGGRDLYNWTSSLPVNASGQQLLPANNTAVAIAFYRTNAMAALAASRTNLAAVTNLGFSLSLSTGETNWNTVTVDFGDILMLRALERVAEFVGYTANAQNGDVVLQTLQNLANTNGLTLQSALNLYPSLLTLANSSDLAASLGALTNAIQNYFAASDFIRNVRSPGANALFILDPDETNSEAQFRSQLTNVLSSLSAPTQFSIGSAALTLDVGQYFAGTKSLRSLLPQFSGDAYVPHTLPDYSFDGILVGEPACVTEAALRKAFPSFSGIYIGNQGQFYDGGNPPVSDFNFINFQSYQNGSFAVFVATNGQATLVGQDNGDGTGDGTDFGLYAQFAVEKGGNWSFTTASVQGNGSLDQQGDFSGELDYTNGISVYLYGLEESPLGPWQNSAGYYAGTYSGTHPGSLYAILAADGEVFFLPVRTGGGVQDGGESQLATNNAFTNNMVNGSVAKGTLTPSTLAVSGTYVNSSGTGGTFSATRSASSPFDIPPAITVALPAAAVGQLGTNITFSLTATGSPPLCYQWYSNDVAVPGAITNTLALDRVQFGAAGTYTVTVSNAVGGTNSAVLLTIVPETTPPTNVITAPTPGERWSNAVFTVTGWATDNVAVATVLYSLNSAAWSNALPGSDIWSNWSAVVNLSPGTNTIAACAVDTSGNYSPTNRVSLDYVVTNQLQVRSLGLGTISPNYSNAWLELGRNYAVTSAPALGFVFTNWTVSTNWIGGQSVAAKGLAFMMASNLTLQSTYVETSAPSLTISAPAAGQHMTNALATLQGTASDRWSVAGVWYQVNGGNWFAPATTNAWSNWTARVELASGTNALKAYAINLGGNPSATNSVSIVSSNTFRLQLALTNGAALDSNGPVVDLFLSIGLNGNIQYSTNLTGWSTLTNFIGTNTSLIFHDPAATNSRQKYYRAVVP